MGRISQKQRVSHCNTLEKNLPSQWKNFACEIEETVYKYYFLSDCREAYELKLQSLVHDLTHSPKILPKAINILDLVKRSSQQLTEFESKNSTIVPASSTIMEYESITSAQTKSKGNKPDEKESKSIKDTINELKPKLVDVIGEDESFIPCVRGCVIEKPGQVKIIDERQSRSVDEPMTLWLECSLCQHSWKQN